MTQHMTHTSPDTVRTSIVVFNVLHILHIWIWLQPCQDRHCGKPDFFFVVVVLYYCLVYYLLYLGFQKLWFILLFILLYYVRNKIKILVSNNCCKLFSLEPLKENKEQVQIK